MEELRIVQRGVTEERGTTERKRIRIEQARVCYGTLMGGFVGMRLTNDRCSV